MHYLSSRSTDISLIIEALDRKIGPAEAHLTKALTLNEYTK